jgi:hypothetical protein
MTAMENKEDRPEHEKVKLELRRLKRSNAPWYFESALHQRLHGDRTAGVRLTPYRMPVAVSLSLGVMALLGIGTYLLMVNTSLFTRLPAGGNGSGSISPTADSAVVVSGSKTATTTPAVRETGSPLPPGVTSRSTLTAVRDSAGRQVAPVIPSTPGGYPAEGKTTRDTLETARRDSQAVPASVPDRRDSAKKGETVLPSRRDTTRRAAPVPEVDSTGARPGGENS